MLKLLLGVRTVIAIMLKLLLGVRTVPALMLTYYLLSGQYYP